jgi:chorismate mutase/prephenate dehydratase
MRLTKEEEYRVLGICKTLAVLGPAGSFSEEVALKLVGSRLPLKYCSTTDEIIRNVEEGNADYGLVPIENSVNGTVLPVLDALLKSNVEVFGETSLEVSHCLASKRNIPFREIKVVYSHPQAIAQCMGFINNYLPQAEIRYTSSTSDAISLLDENSAAIVSENAAKLHRLFLLKKRIQDVGGRNVTRFYIIRKRGSGDLKGGITSLFFGVEDRPGALKAVLEVFYRKNINMRKLESRPARTGLGDYIFFVEVEEDLSDEELAELRNVTTFCHVVGVFDTVNRLDIWK